MNELIKILKLILLFGLVFVLVQGIVILSHFDRAFVDASASIQETAGQASASLAALTSALDTINRPCGAKAPCGTLADVAKTLNTIRGTAGQVEIAIHHEDGRLELLDAQETALFSDTHGVMSNASAALVSANTAVTSLEPMENQLTLEAKNLNATTANLNVLLSDPAIMAAIGNANSSLGHINATVADTQQAVHQWLHPSWPRKLWNGFQAFTVDVGHVLF